MKVSAFSFSGRVKLAMNQVYIISGPAGVGKCLDRRLSVKKQQLDELVGYG
jgi:hypothetical protein